MKLPSSKRGLEGARVFVFVYSMIAPEHKDKKPHSF